MKNSDCFALAKRGPEGEYCSIITYDRINYGWMDKNCGNRGCPFYKPKDCKDWVRLDTDRESYIYPPEEYKKKRHRGKMEGIKLKERNDG